MTVPTPTARRLALVAVVAMLVALLPLAGASAQPPDPDGERIAIDLDGEDAVEYAVRWSQVTYGDDAIEAGDGPTEALLGRADLFADSLASGVLQQERPLLLTSQNTLSADTLAELQRLDVETVHVLGLEAAIAEQVEEQLVEAGFATNRFGGPTRIETAIDIAETVNMDTDNDTALLVRAYTNGEPTQEWADSLAAGGWAAEAGYPVLFTQTEVLTPSTAQHLDDAGYENLIIIGGADAISADVEAQADEIVDDVTRVAGDNRFETAVEIAEARGYENPDDAEGTILVDGQSEQAWADGFPAANLSGRGWPIVLSNSADDSLPEATREYLERSAFADPTPVAAFNQAPPTEDNITVDDGNVVLVCGSTVPDGDEANQQTGDQCAEAAALLDATIVTFQPPARPGASSGIVTACAVDEDSVTITSDTDNDSVTYDYDVDDDTFVVDGEVADAEAFEADCTVGDVLVVTVGEDGSYVLALENREPEDYESGVLGAVDTENDTYEIIEPVSGATLRTITYLPSNTFVVDALPVSEPEFEAALAACAADEESTCTVRYEQGDPEPAEATNVHILDTDDSDGTAGDGPA